METLKAKVARVVQEHVTVVPYDPRWPVMFEEEKYHLIHMVEAHFEHWDRLLFRDYLVDHPHLAKQYSLLKLRLSDIHAKDRVTYTNAKTDFIVETTKAAKEYYRKARKQ